MIHAGMPAPDISLPDADMEWFDLATLRGHKHAVLFFYPRDNTPLCAIEAIDFSDHETEFLRQNCEIIGISRDDCLSHADFRDKHGLSVRLLSDETGDVCRKFGVAQFREKDGHKKLCIIRSTFIIDKEGIVRHALYDVQPKGHAAEVFRMVKALNGASQKPVTKHAKDHHAHR